MTIAAWPVRVPGVGLPATCSRRAQHRLGAPDART